MTAASRCPLGVGVGSGVGVGVSVGRGVGDATRVLVGLGWTTAVGVAAWRSAGQPDRTARRLPSVTGRAPGCRRPTAQFGTSPCLALSHPRDPWRPYYSRAHPRIASKPLIRWENRRYYPMSPNSPSNWSRHPNRGGSTSGTTTEEKAA